MTQAERIRDLRVRVAKMGQTAFARAIGATKPTIFKWERPGADRNMTYQHVRAIAELCKTTTEYVQKGEGDPPPPLPDPEPLSAASRPKRAGRKKTSNIPRTPAPAETQPAQTDPREVAKAAVVATFVAMLHRMPTDAELAAIVDAALALLEARRGSAPHRDQPNGGRIPIVAPAHTGGPASAPVSAQTGP